MHPKQIYPAPERSDLKSKTFYTTSIISYPFSWQHAARSVWMKLTLIKDFCIYAYIYSHCLSFRGLMLCVTGLIQTLNESCRHYFLGTLMSWSLTEGLHFDMLVHIRLSCLESASICFSQDKYFHRILQNKNGRMSFVPCLRYDTSACFLCDRVAKHSVVFQCFD